LGTTITMNDVEKASSFIPTETCMLEILKSKFHEPRPTELFDYQTYLLV
jgi:hypothetical protein